MSEQPFARRHGQIQWTTELKAFFVALWNGDMDIKKIAEILDMTPGGVSGRAQLLRNEGYNLPLRKNKQSAWVSEATAAKLDAMLVYLCGRYQTSATEARGRRRCQDGRLDARRALTLAARGLRLSWKQIAIYFNRTQHTVPIFWARTATEDNHRAADNALLLIQRDKERA